MESVSYLGKRFAVVSQSILPEKSGQSILLSRLLGGVPVEQYCILSNHPLAGSGSPDCLPAKHRKIKDLFQLRLFKVPFFAPLLMLVIGFFEVHRRKKEIRAALQEEGCDLAVACTGDLVNLPATWLACWSLGIPFVAYVMDDFIYQWTGLRRTFARFFEEKFIRDAGAVLVLNEFVQKDYLERYGISPVLLRNPAEERFFIPLDRTVSKTNGTFRLVYAGSIYRAHFDAFQLLSRTIDQYFCGEIELHIYTPQEPASLANMGVTGGCLKFHKEIPANEVVKVYQDADALFLPLAFFSEIPEVLRSSAPFKMSEYLATGKPIFVLSPADSFLSWFFGENRCGFYVGTPSIDSVQAELQILVSNPEEALSRGKKAREIAENFFNLQRAKSIFMGSLNGAILPLGGR